MNVNICVNQLSALISKLSERLMASG